VKVCLVGLPSPELSSLKQLFVERGDIVTLCDPVPPEADLYIFGSGHEAIKHLTHGLVILDLRNDPALEAAPWTPYADLCLVQDDVARALLVEGSGCEPERIFTLPDNEALPVLVDQALRDLLVPTPFERRGGIVPDQPSPPEGLSVSPTWRPESLAARLEAAARRADVMQRGYEVRSRLPLIGPLVAWIRRNLTSHLREPYLDPTLERQVAFNRDLVVILREVLQLQADLEARLARLEEEQTGE
jgi:hypothetical protein